MKQEQDNRKIGFFLSLTIHLLLICLIIVGINFSPKLPIIPEGDISVELAPTGGRAFIANKTAETAQAKKAAEENARLKQPEAGQKEIVKQIAQLKAREAQKIKEAKAKAAAKKAKLLKAKEAERKKSAKEKARKEAEKKKFAEEKARKEVEKKKLAEEKARKEVEKKKFAEEKAQKEADKKKLAEEKARKEADKKKFAEEKAKKEADKKKLAEEKAQKEADKKKLAQAKAEKDAKLKALLERKKAQKGEQSILKSDKIANLIKNNAEKKASKTNANEKLDGAKISDIIAKGAKDSQSKGVKAKQSSLNASLSEKLGGGLNSSELEAFKRQIQPCWATFGNEIPTVVNFELDPGGKVIGDAIRHVSGDRGSSFQRARRAILQCAPYKLPPEKYENWKNVDARFSETGLNFN